MAAAQESVDEGAAAGAAKRSCAESEEVTAKRPRTEQPEDKTPSAFTISLRGGSGRPSIPMPDPQPDRAYEEDTPSATAPLAGSESLKEKEHKTPNEKTSSSSSSSTVPLAHTAAPTAASATGPSSLSSDLPELIGRKTGSTVPPALLGATGVPVAHSSTVAGAPVGTGGGGGGGARGGDGGGGGDSNNSDADTSPPSSPPRGGSPEPDGQPEDPGDSGHGAEAEQFPDDEDILDDFNTLAHSITNFVDTILKDRCPKDFDRMDEDFANIIRQFSIHSVTMCLSPRYAKYVFQAVIWNFLSYELFSMDSGAWACEGRHVQHVETAPAKGVSMPVKRITDEMTEDKDNPYLNRDGFLRWRCRTVDFVYYSVCQDRHYTGMINGLCRRLIWTLDSYVKDEINNGGTKSQEEFVKWATLVITSAGDLARKMRRAYGLWQIFMIRGNSRIGLGDQGDKFVALHGDYTVALPKGQKDWHDRSQVTMTVVPGLVKHTLVVDEDNNGESSWELRAMMPARVFVDLSRDDIAANTADDGDSD